MCKIKKGDFVVRKSHDKDIIFIVKSIINTDKGKIAILKGLVDRIEADSSIEDLEIIKRQKAKKRMKELDDKVNSITKNAILVSLKSNYKIGVFSNNNRKQEKIITGKILHLDAVCFIIYMIRFMRFIKNKI